MNYCHHLASVGKLFTVQASPKPLGQLEPNLAGMFLGWPSAKFLFFVPVGYSTWLSGPIICWLAEISKIFSETNELTEPKLNEGSLECPLPSFCFLCWSEIQDGCHRRTYGNNVSKWFFSETTWTIETKLLMNDHWQVLYKIYVFYADQKSKMATTAEHFQHWTLWENVQMPSSQKLQIRLNPN